MSKSIKALENINHYINSLLADKTFDPHVSTIYHLNEINKIAESGLNSTNEINVCEPEKEKVDTNYNDKVIISCDASITKNPGGTCTSGIVIEAPDKDTLILSRHLPKASTNNEAEYDALWEGIKHIEYNMTTTKEYPIEIHTDSQLVVKQISGECGTNEPKLARRIKIIKEELESLKKHGFSSIEIKWFPRNSTHGLKLANNAAQELNGVKVH